MRHPARAGTRCSPAIALVLITLGAFVTKIGRASAFPLSPDGGSLIGQDQSIKSKASDSLLGIARKYSVGYWEIQESNPRVDEWLPGDGTDIVIPGLHILPPGRRIGIVVNLPEHRLYYYPRERGEPREVITYPFSGGESQDWRTPLGVTRVIRKVPHPIWIPTPRILKAHEKEGDPIPRVWPAGPNNPMGEWALQLSIGGGLIYIHGTNNPMAVGMSVTHGCMRLYPEDIAALFQVVPVGTRVAIINIPIKAAMQDGKLYLEVHRPTHGLAPAVPDAAAAASQAIDRAIGNTTMAIDWQKVQAMLKEANGVPEIVGIESSYNPTLATKS